MKTEFNLIENNTKQFIALIRSEEITVDFDVKAEENQNSILNRIAELIHKVHSTVPTPNEDDYGKCYLIYTYDRIDGNVHFIWRNSAHEFVDLAAKTIEPIHYSSEFCALKINLLCYMDPIKKEYFLHEG